MTSLAGGDWQPGLSSGSIHSSMPLPATVPILIALGLAGHVVGLLGHLGFSLPDRLSEAGRMILAAVAVAGVIVFSPGVAKTFIYIQF
jgi:FtsH-binding integral membrane protein